MAKLSPVSLVISALSLFVLSFGPGVNSAHSQPAEASRQDWPQVQGKLSSLLTRQLSGLIGGVPIESRLEVLIEHGAGGQETVHFRVSSLTGALPSGISSAGLSVQAALLRLELPSEALQGLQGGPSVKYFSSEEWHTVPAGQLVVDGLQGDSRGSGENTAGRNAGDCFLRMSECIHALSPSVFVAQPSAGLFRGSSSRKLSLLDIYWPLTEPESGRQQRRRGQSPNERSGGMPVEITLPLSANFSGTCTFYLGCVVNLRLEHESLRRRAELEEVYDYRAWEGEFTLRAQEASQQLTESGRGDSGSPVELLPGEITPQTRLKPPSVEETVPVPVPEQEPQAPEGMVWVPPGTYTIGMDWGHPQTTRYEVPSHTVTLDGFFIDIFPVTNEQYWAFVSETGYSVQGPWLDYFTPGTERYPARGLSFEDASAYAAWCGKRLPTEEEWEAAARGTDGRIYPWGNDWRPQWVALNGYTSVDAHPENVSPFGVREMVGNVWEWTTSRFAPYPGASWHGPQGYLVLRGGAAAGLPELCRTTCRAGEPPQACLSSIGFRCVMDGPASNDRPPSAAVRDRDGSQAGDGQRGVF